MKVAARAHQTMIWSRVRQVNALRSLLSEYYPAALAAFGTDLASVDALAVLALIAVLTAMVTQTEVLAEFGDNSHRYADARPLPADRPPSPGQHRRQGR